MTRAWNISGTRPKISGRSPISAPDSPRFHLPRFYPILDTALFEARQIRAVEAARVLLAAGTRILQYRHKEMLTQARFEEARAIAELCGEHGCCFIMNDRADAAVHLAAGLHIGQEDVPANAARHVMGAHRPLGLSTHNRAQLKEAGSMPVDYVALGPIFGTRSKRNPDPAVGVAELRALRPLSAVPLVAIGGIGLAEAEAVFEAGADSVAVISPLLPEGPDPLADLEDRVRRWIAAVGP